MVHVVLDAMGGDNAPVEVVKGALAALADSQSVRITLCGRQEDIEAALAGKDYPADRLSIVDARDIISTEEAPVMAIRRKKDSSIVKGMTLVKNKEADAFVSAGSSGAILVGGQLIVGRIRGVERPPLAPLIPSTTQRGVSLLIDCGANVDARSSHLVQFAKMGSIYMEHVLGVKNPRVAIVNIGAEEEKGNMLVKETFPLLKNCPDINFIGSIEAREIPNGGADVIVCEAFVGNVILKMYEGVGKMMLGAIKGALMSSTLGKIGGLLIKPSLKGVMKTFDATEYGGAPLLGLNGLVVKVHGNATEKEISNAIKQCETFKEQNISQRIADKIIIKDE
ncbi:MAG: phosphate acyltransferase PlsX [Lachnospiraceae bacterium]|nr:phosphate acyltransferase PlsX [Lachnospiraceae bacterium]